MPTCHECGLKTITNTKKRRWISFWLDDSGDPAMIRHLCSDCAIEVGRCLHCGILLEKDAKVKWKRFCPSCQHHADEWSRGEIAKVMEETKFLDENRWWRNKINRRHP